MRSKLEIADDSMDDGQRDNWIDDCRSRMLMEMMRSSYLKGNFSVAAKILDAIEKVLSK